MNGRSPHLTTNLILNLLLRTAPTPTPTNPVPWCTVGKFATAALQARWEQKQATKEEALNISAGVSEHNFSDVNGQSFCYENAIEGSQKQVRRSRL